MQGLNNEIQSLYKKIEDNLFVSESQGYWSGLDKNENKELIKSLESMTTKDAIKKLYPYLYDVIFSPKRWGGLELLDIKGDETCVDYGCMWGALTIGLAHRCKHVLGIDQTLESLKFLNKRIKEEKLDNVDVLCGNLKTLAPFQNKVDIGVVNGVLEWVPEEGTVELKTYFGKYNEKDYKNTPRDKQLDFLKKVQGNLKENGKIYLAIENRYDFKMFIGVKDPHAGVRFVSILPRGMANWLSKKALGRPYATWLYSFKGIKDLLIEAGFKKVDLHMCFPDYRFPEAILPFDSRLSFNDVVSKLPMAAALENESTIRRAIKKSARYALGIMNPIIPANYFAPSIIAIGHK